MLHFAIHPDNPQQRLLAKTVDIMRRENGICVYPTDTVYGIGACASNPKAVSRIGELLERDKKRLFSFICADFSQVSDYAKVSNAHFRILKHYLPGPFTFILPATNYVPKKISRGRRTVGIRIPANIVCIELVKLLGEPLANTSIKLPGQSRGDPDIVRPAVLSEVDVMLDTGPLEDPRGSTIVDLTGEAPAVIRSGKGCWNG